LEAPFAYTRDMAPVSLGSTTCAWASIVAQCDIVSHRRGKGIVTAEILSPDGKVVAREQSLVTIGKGRAIHRVSFRVKEPRLWWPLHMGGRELYKIRFILEGEDRVGAPANAEAEAIFGIRTIGLLRQRDREGETFTPLVNGVCVFCRGANWVPASMLPGEVTDADYVRLVGSAAAAGMNCLRVWGGGMYERDIFYDLCDRLGILVWQDFMFACAAYPTYREFLEEVELEAENQITRLRNHPSVMLWCGNNENEWLHQTGWLRRGSERKIIGEQIWSSLLRDIVSEFDPSRPYHQSSPSGRNRNDWNDMSSGDRHNWECWAFWESPDTYLRDSGRFLSEFGFQSLPAMESIARFAPHADAVDSGEIMHHQRMPGGHARLARYLFEWSRLSDRLADWVDWTQRLQAEILAAAVEHWRRRKFLTSGALIWQLNDAYPAVSWSLIDYYGRPKTAYFESRRFFSPLMVSVDLLDEGQSVFAFLPRDHPAASGPPEGLQLSGGDWPQVLPSSSPSRAISIQIVNDLATSVTGTLRIVVRDGADNPETEVMAATMDIAANSVSEAIVVPISDLPIEDIRRVAVVGKFEPSAETRHLLDTLGNDLRVHLLDWESRLKVPDEAVRPSSLVRVDAGLECIKYLVAPKYRI
jgi:beta-mannosidase